MARLLSLIAPSIVSAVRVVAGRDVDVEDAAQEAMMAIVDAVPRFRGQSELSALRPSDRRSHRLWNPARRPTAVAPAGGNRDRGGAGRTPSSAGATLQNAALERNECLAAFQRLLDELPEGQAESLTYRVLLEYPLPVIARELKVPVNTVRSRIRLAREHLRESHFG